MREEGENKGINMVKKKKSEKMKRNKEWKNEREIEGERMAERKGQRNMLPGRGLAGCVAAASLFSGFYV